MYLYTIQFIYAYISTYLFLLLILFTPFWSHSQNGHFHEHFIDFLLLPSHICVIKRIISYTLSHFEAKQSGSTHSPLAIRHSPALSPTLFVSHNRRTVQHSWNSRTATTEIKINKFNEQKSSRGGEGRAEVCEGRTQASVWRGMSNNQKSRERAKLAVAKKMYAKRARK